MDILNLIDSSDDEEVIDFIEHLGRNRRPKLIRERPNNFQLWDDHDFFDRYRLSKDSVRRILDEIYETIAQPTDWNCALTPEEMLFLTLRFYATASFLNTVGDLIGVHKSTASKVVKKVSNAIAALRHRYICFPITDEEILSNNEGFYNIASFPQVIGAIDCTHVKIQSPGGENAEIFRNRKGYFSLNIQTVCDHKLKIRDIVSRWHGSTHDSHIFNNSYIRQRFERGEFGQNILLGDGGYRNSNFLLTPLLNPATPAENLYNESHIRTRNCVERMYGVWKRRFPVLANGVRLKISTVQTIVVATAVLHNIACDAHEDVPPVQQDMQAAIEFEGNIQPHLELHNGNNNRRNNLINNYFQNLL